MKKLILFVMVAALALVTIVSFAACNVTTTQGTDSIAKDYDADEVEAKIDAMRTNGYLFHYKVTLDGADEKEVADFTYAAKGDIYYLDTQDSEVYYDLSSEDYKDVYTKEDEGEWTLVRTYYTEQDTKEDAIADAKALTSVQTGYMTYYGSSDEASNDSMIKTTGETVAGRNCDKYVWGMDIKVLFVKAKTDYACYIDTETGICLKWNWSASASVGSADSGTGGVNFECTQFDTSCTIVLPDVAEDNTTVVDERPEV